MILKVYVDTTNTFCLVAKRKKSQFLSFFEMSHLIEQHPKLNPNYLTIFPKKKKHVQVIQRIL